jgi:MoaA/NifB/PqqE/SkfB family radical SAM enzyme
MTAEPSPSLPGPWRATFDTNPDDCNLKCVMCEEHSDLSDKKRERLESHRAHRRMDRALIRRIVSELAPRGLREIIPSTMGEPLLFEGFDEFIDVCREFGIQLNLTTNGTWPRRGPVGWAELLCPIGSDIKVSWNGVTALTQEAIMPGSSLTTRISDLRTFVALRDRIAKATAHYCRLTLQCTFMESNLDELPSLVEFAGQIGVDRVKGHHLWVHFGQLAEQDLRRRPESRQRWNEIVRACQEAASLASQARGRKLRLDNFLTLPNTSQDVVPEGWECPFLGQEVWVNANGRFDPCCAPDLERQSLGHFGLVTNDGGLMRIWEGDAYRALVQDYRSRRLCAKCTMRRPAVPVD